MPADTAPTRLTVDEYYGLVDQGLLSPDDRVELLEGVVVSMPPSPPAATATTTHVIPTTRC